MLLAAGYGTRLGDLTRGTPKPMLDVGGKPVIDWILRHLASHGFGKVGINLHYQGGQIREHVTDGSRFGLEHVQYFDEPELLGTAGGVRNAAPFLVGEGPFLVQYGDVVTDHDLRTLLDSHRHRGSLATILVHERPGSNSIAVLDSEGRVSRFLERPDDAEREAIASPWVFSGICILEPEAVEAIPPTHPSDLPGDLFPRLAEQRAIHACPLSGFRVAVDSVERLRLLRDAIGRGACGIEPK